jgi:hypothetical protein
MITPAGWPLLGRLMWMMLGPLALTLITFAIVSEGSGWLTRFDAAFAAVLLAMLVGRWLEFRGGRPQTASGQPASRSDLERYFLIAAVAGMAVWLAANVVGNHLLPR